ncbi:hypothetical protein N7492_006668 [Penicillium capsulatum]|uniref:Glycolipid transfer protein domain-containing protein n=1 Tax=Penicillium capsulatum TaxID=69766 RepID=A0A9W9I0L9_9EURO|nr:hypothetical protein N7492_006668 [Penicillium capsulatum]
MATWFDTISKSFADVPIDAANDNAISTAEFLEAAEALVTLFDVLGSAAFTPVKNDLLGNIKKVRDRLLAAPAESQTLQDLVLNELKAGKKTASGGLLWLCRGLDFTAQALRHNLDNPSVELSASFREAYGGTLKPHHSWDFYKKLGNGDETKVATPMEKEVAALEKVVGILKTFQARKDVQVE